MAAAAYELITGPLLSQPHRVAPAKFYSFTDAEANTKEQIQKARSHPWISQEVPIRGFVYDVSTGRLSEVFPDGETATS
jgi:carbonic anhydrase